VKLLWGGKAAEHMDYETLKVPLWCKVWDLTIMPVQERWAATKMLVRPDEPKAMYVGRRMRAKAFVLLWLLPVRWTYEWDRCRHCDQICGYDESRYGGEYDSWEATFLAAPSGWRLGRCHIYRDGGP